MTLISLIGSGMEFRTVLWIPELEETVAEAQDALENLKRLQYALEELSRELEEVKCMMST